MHIARPKHAPRTERDRWQTGLSCLKHSHFHSPFGFIIRTLRRAGLIEVMLIGQSIWIAGWADGGEGTGEDQPTDLGFLRGAQNITGLRKRCFHSAIDVACRVRVCGRGMKNHFTAAHRLDEGGSIIQVATEPIGAEITNRADRVRIATQGANLPAARNRRSNYLSANETGCAKDEAGGHGVGTVNAALDTAGRAGVCAARRRPAARLSAGRSRSGSRSAFTTSEIASRRTE